MPERRSPRSASVIMPVLNAQDHVAEALAGLARQDYSGDWEVVIADNGCSDRTLEIVDSWRARLPELRVVDASDRRGAAHARNVAADAARGEFLACCDADNVPSSGWLRGLVDAAAAADLVGAQDDRRLLNADLSEGWPPLRDLRLRGESGFLSVGGGKLGVWTDVGRRLRWDESLWRSGEDVDFSWRARLSGMTFVRAPEAVVHKRLRRRLSSLAGQAFWSGYSVPRLHARYGSSGLRVSGQSGRERGGRFLAELRVALRSRAARARIVWDLSFAVGRLAGWWGARGESPAPAAAGEAAKTQTA